MQAAPADRRCRSIGLCARMWLAQRRQFSVVRLSVEETAQQRRHALPVELRRHNPAADAEPIQTRRVVRLIETHWHRQLRYPCRESLRQRADSAVADECCAPRQHVSERHEWFMVSGGWQRWKMSAVPREQERPSSKPLACVERGRKEPRRGLVGCSRCKENR